MNIYKCRNIITISNYFSETLFEYHYNLTKIHNEKYHIQRLTLILRVAGQISIIIMQSKNQLRYSALQGSI